MTQKRIALVLATLLLAFVLVGCDSAKEEPVTLTLAAAASLKNVLDGEILPAFQKEYPIITVQPTYDSSGKLQTQIESGAPVDVFIPAATSNMTALNAKGLMMEYSIANLLENKTVLIVPVNSTKGITSFTEVTKADKIAIGDPASVPAGKYAKEAFTNLKIWEALSGKLSLGTNVTEVLNWVAEGSADAGVVYSTDALSNPKVKVVAEAPEGSVSKVLYPIGIVKASTQEEASKIFIDFLKKDASMNAFVKAGFIQAK